MNREAGAKNERAKGTSLSKKI